MQVYILQFSVYILLFLSLNLKINDVFLMLFWKQSSVKAEGSSVSAEGDGSDSQM